MSNESNRTPTVVGRRMRSRRGELGWSQEKIGLTIGIDESSSRDRISRYELGVHEPAVKTTRLIVAALDVPLPYLYCENDNVAALLLELHVPEGVHRARQVKRCSDLLADFFPTDPAHSLAQQYLAWP